MLVFFTLKQHFKCRYSSRKKSIGMVSSVQSFHIFSFVIQACWFYKIQFAKPKEIREKETQLVKQMVDIIDNEIGEFVTDTTSGSKNRKQLKAINETSTEVGFILPQNNNEERTLLWTSISFYPKHTVWTIKWKHFGLAYFFMIV